LKYAAFERFQRLGKATFLLCNSAILSLFGMIGSAQAHDEKHHAAALCKDKDHEVVVTNDNTRMDCIGKVFVYEVDWSEKWHEGIGQALYYAASEKHADGKDYLPGLILICKHSTLKRPVNPKTCHNHYERAKQAFEHHGIKGQIWFCLNGARRRDQCVSERFGFDKEDAKA